MVPHMIICNICKFLYGLVQLLLRPKFVQIRAFVLQSIEIPLHRRIVLWISGSTHALDYMGGFAELYECFCCILAPLVAVQKQAVF